MIGVAEQTPGLLASVVSVRVLHVGTDPGDAAVTRERLEGEDDRIEVVTETDTGDGLATLAGEAEPVDCVVSAHDPPRLDGLGFLERVREEWPDLPFVLFTGEGVDDAATDAISMGATDYLQKGRGPGQYTLLAHRITNAVEARRAKAGATARADRPQFGREFLERGLDVLDDIFYAVSPEGEFEWWNRALPERTGYSDGEIDEMTALDFFEGEDCDRVRAGMSDVLETGSGTIEAEIVTRDGRRIPHEFRGIRLTGRDGAPTGIIGIGRDITERTQREQRLERQNDRLNQFADVVSHDLRNPLNVARTRLELARQETESEHFEAIERAHERMDTLIESVLRLARMREEGLDEPETVDLADITVDSLETVPTTDATVVIDTDAVVRADRTQLRQLLENLFRNAVEHGSTSPPSQAREDAVEHGSTSPRSHAPEDAVEGGIVTPKPGQDRQLPVGERTESAGPVDDSGDAVTITVGDTDEGNGFYVADDGPGIPEQERERVLQNGYSLTADGTGLGLSIVATIARAHGWEFTITEGDGGGARFEFTGVDVLS